MRRNASVTLGHHYDEFVDSQIESGGFCSRSEVVRAGLSLLEMHQAKIKALKHAIDVGIKSESDLYCRLLTLVPYQESNISRTFFNNSAG